MTEAPRVSKFSHAYRALRHRNFKLFFAGQGISVIGTWMTRMATSWLVYSLTHSALLFGAAPIGSLISGALAEKIGAAHTILITGAGCILTAIWFTFEIPKIRNETRMFFKETP